MASNSLKNYTTMVRSMPLFRVGLTFGLVWLLADSAWSQIPNDYGYNEYKEKLPKESFVQIELVNQDVFDIGKDGLEFYYEFNQQILCLNKRAVGLKKRSVGYDDFFPITDIEATLYYPVKGRYKKEKVKDFNDQAVIKNEISFYDNYREKQFSFENIREGSLVELNVKRKVVDEHLLSPRTFSRNIFIEKEVYRAKVHKDIDIGFFEINMDSSDIEKKVYEDGDYKIYEWRLEKAEIKPLYGQNDYEDHYLPQVVPYLRSVKTDGEKRQYFEDLDGLFKWYSSLISQVNTENDSSIKALATSITEGIEGETEKVKAVYEWVQSNIKYIAFGDGYGGFIPRDPDVIYDRKFGDCKDMSCLTVNLLRALEIKSYFSWVGTNTIALNYTDVPSPAVDNHMIVSYYDQSGNLYYLDATDPNLSFGRPSYGIQGREVLIALSDSAYRLDTADILPAEVSQAYEKMELELDANTLKGSGESRFSGYFAEDLHASYARITDEGAKDEFINGSVSKGSNKFQLGDYEYQWDAKSKDTVKLKYDFKIGDYVNRVDDKVYVNLNLSGELNQLKIRENQNTPYFMDYKYIVENVFELDLKDEYRLEYLPEDVSSSSDLLDYEINYSQEENHIKYHLLLKVNQIRIEKDRIKDWNDQIDELISQLNKTIKLISK